MIECLHIMPLIADAGWFGLIVALVIMAVGALNQILNKANEKREREALKRPQPQRPPRSQRPPRHQRPSRAPGDAVDDFLRRVSQEQEVEAVEAEVVEAVGVGNRSDPSGVSAHVSDYMASREFDQRGDELTQVDDADEKVEEHLHEVFDHKLGRLGSSAYGQKILIASPVAESLINALRSPEGLVTAIIIQEILQRPSFDD